MPAGQTRLYSQFLAESEATSSVGTSSRISSESDPWQRQARGNKRRKTAGAGLNSRFDRMLEKVNVTHRSPIKKQKQRVRSSTSGSSSVGGYDMPKTPVDAYSNLEGGRLGESFSVIKMKNSYSDSRVVRGLGEESSSSDDPFQVSGAKVSPSDPLPHWLCGTFSALDPRNPLRALVPTLHDNTGSSDPPTNSSPPLSPANAPIEEETPIFAFIHQTAEEPENDVEMLHQEQVVSDDRRDEQRHDYNSQFLPPIVSTAAQFSGDVSRNPVPCVSYQPGPQFPDTPGTMTGPHSGWTPRIPDLPSSPVFPPPTFDRPSITHQSVVSPVAQMSINPRDQLHHALPAFPAYPYNAPSPLLHRTLVSPSNRSPPTTTGRLAFARDYPDMYSDENYAGLPTDPPRSDTLLGSPGTDVNFLDVFSTPGPGHATTVYFDSPAEDPSDSDPLEPDAYELDLDYNTLDFRWEPFDRKDVHAVDHAVSNTTVFDTQRQAALYTPDRKRSLPNAATTILHYDCAAQVDTTEQHQHFESSDDYYMEPSGSSPSIPVLETAVPPSPEPEHIACAPALPEPSPPSPKVFAPAPGIYVSPLRNAPDSSEPQVEQDAVAPVTLALPVTPEAQQGPYRGEQEPPRKTPKTPSNQGPVDAPKLPARKLPASSMAGWSSDDDIELGTGTCGDAASQADSIESWTV
ncbi:hypothetical protein PLICRDRAFT_172479 [Plicaturopsis crispa FD-325 SS-3]|nr:hypothetical protein PLICRDRAFT_172479 [Plicaturopsis crispa FD-325 SS-3]